MEEGCRRMQGFEMIYVWTIHVLSSVDMVLSVRNLKKVKRQKPSNDGCFYTCFFFFFKRIVFFRIFLTTFKKFRHWKFMQQKQPHSSSNFVHVSMAEKSQNSAWQIYDTLTRIWTEYDNLSCMAFWFHDQQ